VAEMKVSAAEKQEERKQEKGFNAEKAEEAQRSQRGTQRQREKVAWKPSGKLRGGMRKF
jgi:hypothetical protein